MASGGSLSHLRALLRALSIPLYSPNPSISESKRFNAPPPPPPIIPPIIPPPIPPCCPPRLIATASTSSRNRMHAPYSRAYLRPFPQNCMTRMTSMPQNMPRKPDPSIPTNGMLEDPAIALARKVFPLPGSPVSRMPWGGSPPISRNWPRSVSNWVHSRISLTRFGWPQ